MSTVGTSGFFALGRRLDAVRRGALNFLQAALRDERGNIAILSALALPVLFGALGLGFETANWRQTAQLAQHAADSAAVAAATNGGDSYAAEAKAVAAQYGFQDGVNGVTVTVSNGATCPSGDVDCYHVTITKPVPLILAPIVGYRGDIVLSSGAAGKALSANAGSVLSEAPRTYCLLALVSSGARQGVRSNGAPDADLSGCNVMSNADAVCNGGDLSAVHGDAHGSSSGCGATQNSNLAAVADPYISLAANVPSDPCHAYPQEPTKKWDPPLPVSNKLSGPLYLTGTTFFCGDVQLAGDVSVSTASPGAVIVIENGQLDTNGHTLQTLYGAGLTVIFSGTGGHCATSYVHAPTGGGVLDFAAPTSGTWSGVALYQDPKLTEGVDVSAAGNSPTWNITGLVYLPHASVTFSGAVNKASNGLSCFAFVADNFTINGTASILSQGQCAQAGLNMPTGMVPSRGKLVS